jgi:hypothetical protein
VKLIQMTTFPADPVQTGCVESGKGDVADLDADAGRDSIPGSK